MIWTVIEWIAILAECFMVARLMIRYFGFRSPEKRLLKWGILVGILVCIDALGSFLIQNEIILVAGFVLTNFIYAAILLRGNFFEKMVVAAISYMLFYFINLPVLTVLSSLSESAPAAIANISSQHLNRVIGIFVTKLLYFVLTQVILIVRKKEKYRFKINEWIVIISAFILTMTIAFCIHTLILGYPFEEYIYIAVSFLLSILDIIIFVFMGKMNRANQKELEQQQLQTQLRYRQNEIQQIESQYQKISMLRHDYKNQLNCLRTLIEENNFDEAKSYLGKIIGSQSDILSSHIHCSNSVLNAVINEKFTAAEKKGIETTCKILITIPEYLEYDLSILLSNLLDNAIEACAKEESPTQIMMLIKKTHGYYRIVVKNTIRESVLQKNRELKSDKENKALHGWGLRSVAEIAERHLGGLDIYEKNGMFVVSVLLANDEFGNLGTKEETVGANILFTWMVSEMIAELSKRMSLFLCKKEIVEQEMAEVYQYGFEIIFSTLIGFFITIAIGAVFRMFLVSLVYYFAFVALRQFTGGYHANTYLKCNLIFAASTTFIFGMAKIVAYGTYPISFHVMLLLFSLVAIWFKTPVENENKPLSEEQKVRNHRISMIVAVIFSGISCFAYQKWVLISATIALTLFVIALMAVIANPSREEENES